MAALGFGLSIASMVSKEKERDGDGVGEATGGGGGTTDGDGRRGEHVRTRGGRDALRGDGGEEEPAIRLVGEIAVSRPAYLQVL